LVHLVLLEEPLEMGLARSGTNRDGCVGARYTVCLITDEVVLLPAILQAAVSPLAPGRAVLKTGLDGRLREPPNALLLMVVSKVPITSPHISEKCFVWFSWYFAAGAAGELVRNRQQPSQE
jgi:hypothetical protein